MQLINELKVRGIPVAGCNKDDAILFLKEEDRYIDYEKMRTSKAKEQARNSILIYKPRPEYHFAVFPFRQKLRRAVYHGLYVKSQPFDSRRYKARKFNGHYLSTSALDYNDADAITTEPEQDEEEEERIGRINKFFYIPDLVF